jgi:hypothetical protein
MGNDQVTSKNSEFRDGIGADPGQPSDEKGGRPFNRRR